MRTIGIIAEYNPFHNGHAWQIRTAKVRTQADCCVVIMSPDYVQRGMPAITDKYTRTAMALEGGADVVLELPVRYALASAQGFARGAAGILNALGCVDQLVFGCETEDPGLLEAAARILVREPEGYRALLSENLRKGVGFAAAREKALQRCLLEGLFEADSFGTSGCDAPEIPFEALTQALAGGLLHQPNNILGLEYCIALKWMHSAITPCAIRRRGAGYHDTAAAVDLSSSPAHPDHAALRNGELFLSASGIRSLILEGDPAAPASSALPAIPAKAGSVLKAALKENGIPSTECFSTLLHYALLRCPFEEPAAAANIPCDPYLLARIRKMLPQYRDAASFSASLTSRQFPLTTVNRALLRIFLGLSQEACTPADPGFPDSYVRILGFRRSASPLLHELTRRSSIPVITKPAAASGLLSKKQLAGFEADVNASHLYQLLFQDRVKGIVSEYTRSPIIK